MKAMIQNMTTREKTINRPPLWTANFIWVCLVTLSITFVFHCFNATLPVYINTYGGTVKYAGLALTALTVAAIVVRPMAGVFLDRYGRKVVLILGVFLFILPVGFYLMMLPVYLLIIFRFVQGIGWGSGHTATGTIALDVIPGERLGEGLGIYSLLNSVSMSFAPALSLWLIDAFSFERLFLVCLFIGAAAFLMSFLIKYPQMKKQPGSGSISIEKTSIRPSIIILFIVFTHSAPLSFLPLFAIERGLPTAGIFFTAVALSALVSRFISGILLDRLPEKGYDINIIIGTLSTITALFILARTSGTAHLLLGGIFYGFGFGVLQLTLHLLSVMNAPVARKAMANATYWTAYDAGVSAGSFFWGFVAVALGFSSMFNLTVIPVIISFALYLFWRIKLLQLQPGMG
ncbi:MAG: MFS transporter [Bacillota bacterium]|nr:MFS transporter [Bacillota bacterium]